MELPTAERMGWADGQTFERVEIFAARLHPCSRDGVLRNTRSYGWGLGLVMGISFPVLGVVGHKAINYAPPIPHQVVTADGQLQFTGGTIRDGQSVWQSTGGQEIGTLWGHCAYVAPDWSADYLHRPSIIVLDA